MDICLRTLRAAGGRKVARYLLFIFSLLSEQQEVGQWHACTLRECGVLELRPSPAFSPRLQDPFVAFHIDKGLVRKYMNSLLIGELSPEQPSFEPTKNVRPCLCLGALVVEGEGAESQPGWSPKGALSQLPGNSGPPRGPRLPSPPPPPGLNFLGT